MPAAVRGALWMGGAVLSFSVMAIAVRELLRTMRSFEILFLRSVSSLAILLAILPFSGPGPRSSSPCRPGPPSSPS
jgi:drug/metabolite transporter (DMT)-like permease